MKQRFNYLFNDNPHQGVASRDEESGTLVLETDGEQFQFQVKHASDGHYLLLDEKGIEHAVVVSVSGQTRWITVNGRTHCLDKAGRRGGGKNEQGAGGLSSPMPGKVILVHVEVGQEVVPGDVLMVVEAMKMEHAIVAKEGGVIGEIHFGEGDRVQAGATLLSMVSAGETE